MAGSVREPSLQGKQALENGACQENELTKLKLTCSLDHFPREAFDLAETLEQLDLSDTGLSCLPTDLGSKLRQLKVAFFSNCSFASFPKELAACPKLEMVAFRRNNMQHIPEDAFPPQLRWLILTDNQIGALPASIGKCHRLQKCMLAGNQLTHLPVEMSRCKKLGLLRLSANRVRVLPAWLFEMPELAFLSFAGNPCSSATTDGTHVALGLADVAWADLEVQHKLGEGASGIISQAVWKQCPPAHAEEVAIKLFRGALTSDGTPADEMAAFLAAGSHENLIGCLGRIYGHPDEGSEGARQFQGGIVMSLVPRHYGLLGQPPSLASCTRDTYADGTSRLDAAKALAVLGGVAGALRHLHARGIAHGDVYAHNVLLSGGGDGDGGGHAHALLGDFGAASLYGPTLAAVERLEVLAFAHMVEDVLGLLADGSEEVRLRRQLSNLHERCAVSEPAARPCFADIEAEMQSMPNRGRRGV